MKVVLEKIHAVGLIFEQTLLLESTVLFMYFYCCDSWRQKAGLFSQRPASNSVYLVNFSLWFMLLLIHSGYIYIYKYVIIS